MTAHVRPCGYDDVKPLGAALGAAFRDDPVFEHLVPGIDVDERARRLSPFFAADVQVHRNLGEVWTTDDAAAGALWTPPGRRIPEWRQLRTGWWFARASWRTVRAGMRVLAAIEHAHPRDRPHWYLATLGTAPEHQGRGLGSAVLAPVLDRCDRTGTPAYLESSKESNIPYYERFGFRVQRELPLGRGAPPVWLMWREPGAA